jgi:hypothetical protein
MNLQLMITPVIDIGQHAILHLRLDSTHLLNNGMPTKRDIQIRIPALRERREGEREGERGG